MKLRNPETHYMERTRYLSNKYVKEMMPQHYLVINGIKTDIELNKIKPLIEKLKQMKVNDSERNKLEILRDLLLP